MNILLISGRSATGNHPSVAQAAGLAPALVAGGHRVRWLAALRADETAPEAPDGVDLVGCATPVLPFRAVVNRVCDLELEKVLTRMLREEPVEVVDCLAFGGLNCVNLPWVAASLGAAAIVRADLAATVCHRATLIDWTGAPCEQFDDPRRCAECCLTPGADALGPVGAGLGRMLQFFGDASPWPAALDFENRLDLVVGDLLAAARVLVATEAARAALIGLGVSKRAVVVAADPGVAELLDLYASCAASAPA